MFIDKIGLKIKNLILLGFPEKSRFWGVGWGGGGGVMKSQYIAGAIA